jgi:hypothetical protein
MKYSKESDSRVQYALRIGIEMSTGANHQASN